MRISSPTKNSPSTFWLRRRRGPLCAVAVAAALSLLVASRRPRPPAPRIEEGRLENTGRGKTRIPMALRKPPSRLLFPQFRKPSATGSPAWTISPPPIPGPHQSRMDFEKEDKSLEKGRIRPLNQPLRRGRSYRITKFANGKRKGWE